jgi:uncharacterized protein YbjT (DUF2867 family)
VQERILVTGGTGLLGRLVAARLVDAGRAVRVTSRRPRPAHDRVRYEWAIADLRSGQGAGEAVAGVRVIVHCATAFGRGTEVDVARAVVEAAQRAESPHLVYISIVGVDRVPLGYYRAKLAAERLIEHSGLPYTILRATQFHDLVRTLLAGAARAPVMLVPDFRFQPVDVGEVAVRLTELALGEPAGHAPDFAGPQVRDARDLARAYLRATGRRRAILPVRLPGTVFGAYRQGGNLAPEHAAGKITFEEYLTRHPDPRSVSYRGRPE